MFETDEEYRRRIGRIELGAGQDFRGLDFRSRGQVTCNFVIAILVTLGVTALAGWLYWPNLGHACLAIVGCALYCVVASFVHPRPNHDELGALNGMFNNPFRWSDDYNGKLVHLALVLAPGCFVAGSIVEGLRLIRTGKLPHERYIDSSSNDNSPKSKTSD